ncbi:MAG TPA: T9SS type A sorting domain-containing protein, partial [Flavobacteriales bacterium]|nr:T9SS type A sorting domain-containing protein [Flavobacteriales bacterium]
PNGFTSTEQNPVVTEAGIYTLTVTGENGCTSTASATVELDNEAPGASAEGGTLTCAITSIQLQGNGNGSFSWSGPNGFTSTEQNPVVTEAGIYTLTVTGENGCTSTASATVELDNEAPGASAEGGTLTCAITSIQLQGNGNGSFSWSGPNGFTSTEQNPTVTEAGTYTLTVTGENGCTSQATATVELDNEAPGASAEGGTLTCAVTSIQLHGNGNGSFSWSGPNGFTSTEQNPTVTEAGTYTLTVTGENGCTSQATATVELDNEAPGASAEGGTLTCAVTSIQLHGNGNGSFSWSGPNGFSSTEQNPTVTEAGTYTLTVTGENGCTSTATATVELDNDMPEASAEGGVITCNVTEVTLMGNGNGSFSWTGPNGFTSTEQNPVVTEAGTYILTVTGENGCSSQATATVELDNEAPGAQAVGGVLDCTTHSAMLQGMGNGSFSWSGPNGFTSTQQNPVVTEAGTYTLTVTGENGCTSTATATVEEGDCGGCDTPIIISCPEPVTVECGEDIDPWTIGLPVIRKDKDCPEVIYFNYYDEFSGTCPIVVTRHWTFRDTEGNEETCEQTIFIEDTQAPVLMNVPADVTVVCGNVPGIPTEVWAQDCKTNVPVIITEDTIPGQFGVSYTIIRTFTATDACNNSTTATQTITVVGCKEECDTPIIISCAPAVVTVECGASIDPEDIGYPVTRKDDNCPEVVYFNWVDWFSGTCPVTVTRHWTFRDVNGNEETCDQTIIIQDTQAPELMNVPDDVTVVCGNVPEWPKNVWAADCKEDVPVIITDVVVPGESEGTYTVVRTFRATDACGNTAQATQVITVVGCKDECEAPIIISCAPTVITVECGASIDPEDVGYPITRKSADCPEVNYFNWVDYWQAGYYTTTVTRHWTFRDAAGNEETCDQTIYITGCGGNDQANDQGGVKATLAQSPVTNVAVAPNPFRNETKITFRSEMDGRATVAVTNMAGQVIGTLFEGEVRTGETKSIEWKPEGLNGGLYFYRIDLNGYPTTGKISYRP